jgi:hypothetical protein
LTPPTAAPSALASGAIGCGARRWLPPTNGLCVLLAVSSLYDSAGFGEGTLAVLLGLFAAWAVLLLWWFSWFVRRVAEHGWAGDWDALAVGWRRQMFVPVVAVVVIALHVGAVPLRVRFWVSKPALDRVAVAVLAAPDRAWVRWGRAGLWSLDSVQHSGTSVRARLPGNDMNVCELVFSPNAQPIDTAGQGVLSLGGSWYYVVRSQ